MDNVEPRRGGQHPREAKTDQEQGSIDRAGIRWGLVGVLFLVSALTLVALNSPALKSPMIYDSCLFLLAKSDVYQQHSVWEVVRLVPVRPLHMATLYLNYLAAGMEPQYFRVVNIVLVAASGAALALLIFLVLDLVASESRCSIRQRLAISLVLGLVFVIHPLQTFVTLYIWQREAILACLFYFSAVAVYIATRSGRFQRPAIGYGLTAALFFAGMLCKENVATVPLVLVAAEATVLRQDLKQLGGRVIRIGGLVVVPLLLYYIVTHGLTGSESGDLANIMGRLSRYYEYAGLSPVAVVLTESRAVFSYLITMLLPVPEILSLVKAMTVSVSLLNPPITIAAFAGLIGLIGSGIALSRRRSVTAFGILFFLISLIPESALIPQYLFCGYRAILPMAGLLMVLGDAGLWLLAQSGSNRGASFLKIALMVLLPIVLGSLLGLTYFRAVSWSPLSVWQEAHEKLPASPEHMEKKPYIDIISNLSELLGRKGRHLEAARLCRQALAIFPEDSGIHDRLGVALLHGGRVGEAITVFRKAVQLDPKSFEAFNNLGNALLAANRNSEAIEAYRHARKLNPSRVQPYLNLGAAHLKAGEYELAREVLQKGVGVNPRHAKARANLGITLVKLGLFSQAIDHLNEAIRLDPGLVFAYLNLAIAWERLGDIDHAVQSYERALDRAPTFVSARANLAAALAKLGRYSEAAEQYGIVLRAEPKNYKAHNDLAHALIMTSQFDKAAHHCRKALAIKPDFADAQTNLKRALARTTTDAK